MDAAKFKKLVSANKGTSFFVIVLIFALLYLLFLSPNPSVVEREKSELDKKISDIRFNINNAKSLDEDLERSNQLVEQINAGLIDPQKETANLRYFYEIADRNRSTIISAEFAGIINKEIKHFSTKRLLVKVKGSLTDVMAWYKDVQSGKFFLLVKSFELNPIKSAMRNGTNPANDRPQFMLSVTFDTIGVLEK